MLSINIVNAIHTAPFEIHNDFFSLSKANEYMSLCHTHYFYTYPEFGKEWKNKDCQYHKFEASCEICKSKTDYNKFGIGFIYLFNTGSQIVFRCENHLFNATKFKLYKKNEQLTLFQ